MLKWGLLVGVLFFSVLLNAGERWRSQVSEIAVQDRVLLDAGFLQEQVKDCAVVFPIPRAEASWKNCEEVESTECGGPPGKCICREAERLITYKCDGGTYKSCEYDPGCVNGS
jgi:hypothetical protein